VLFADVKGSMELLADLCEVCAESLAPHRV